MNQFRSSYLYVARGTRRRLHLLATATGGTTPDEMADKLLNKTIERDFPAIIKLEKKIMKLEEELRDELNTTKTEDSNVE